MLTLSKRFLVRTLALGFVCAVASFCYATVGNRGLSASAPAAEGRIVGSTTLTFTNAILSDAANINANTYDLGDACYGSQITRYLTAGGGLRPYAFIELNKSMVNQLAVNSSLMLGLSGCMMGSVTGIARPNVPLLFQAQVTDSAGTTPFAATGNFQLNMVICGPNEFRFAVDRINNGFVGLNYISKLEVLGGNKTVTFSVMPNTLTVDGVPKGSSSGLEAIGLSLAADGTIMGRPLQPGRISFVARATDSIKRIAASRSGAVQDQLITFTIIDNPVTASDFTTMSCKIKGDVGLLNRDTITFSGYINLSGAAISSLNGSPFVFQVGGASFEGRFNATGQVVNARGGPLVFEDGSRMVASVNPRSGQLSGAITRASLSKKLDAINIANRSTKRYSVGITICTAIVSTDVLEFVTRRNGDKYQADYQLGRLGQSLGGNFQIISVKGTDKRTIAGNNGVAWSVKFLAIPRFGIDANPGLDALTSVGIRIGTRFNQKFIAPQLTSTARGDIRLAPNNLFGETVSRFQLSARSFRGSVVTQPLSFFVTGIRAAADAGTGAANFTFGLDLDRTGTNTDFSGEAAKRIIAGQRSNGKNTNWIDQVNLR
ncbi:MAG TPA: hypothetical protein VEK08_17560 [Planctomycetota bacterium]|nr:hypothetical protein [Planctomycetota bacterium]